MEQTAQQATNWLPVITVVASNIVTIVITVAMQFWNYKIKVKEMEETRQIKLLEMNFERSKAWDDTFITFATTTARTLTKIDLAQLERQRLPAEDMMEFDSVFYPAYVLLEEKRDRENFIIFRNNLRNCAFYPRPDGISHQALEDTLKSIQDDNKYYMVEPIHLYQDFEMCLSILQRCIDGNKRDKLKKNNN